MHIPQNSSLHNTHSIATVMHKFIMHMPYGVQKVNANKSHGCANNNNMEITPSDFLEVDS